MKSFNLFSKVFVGTAILTIGFLSLASYSSKKAIAADPELLNRLQSKYNITISGFGITPSHIVTKDSWNFSGPIKKIKLATVDGDLRVTTADGNDLSIEVEGRLPKDAEKDERLLKIKTEDGEIRISDGRGVTKLRMLIKVPKDVESFSLGTVSGDVSMRNILVKEFEFNSVSGDLQAENVHFLKTTGVTVSGDMNLSNAEPGTVKFQSVSGDVMLKLASAQQSKFTLKTISGEIKNSRPSTEGSLEVSVNTTSGDIDIE